jgi:hypothetical protein
MSSFISVVLAFWLKKMNFEDGKGTRRLRAGLKQKFF